MKIKSKVKIGAHWVKVKWVNEIEGRIAQAVLPENRIELARFWRDSDGTRYFIAESLLIEGFLHEIGHFILFQSGYGEFTENSDVELVNQAFCHGMLQVIRDNDLDFREEKCGRRS
mgnify:CR=1 FL=1